MPIVFVALLNFCIVFCVNEHLLGFLFDKRKEENQKHCQIIGVFKHMCSHFHGHAYNIHTFIVDSSRLDLWWPIISLGSAFKNNIIIPPVVLWEGGREYLHGKYAQINHKILTKACMMAKI